MRRIIAGSTSTKLEIVVSIPISKSRVTVVRTGIVGSTLTKLDILMGTLLAE